MRCLASLSLLLLALEATLALAPAFKLPGLVEVCPALTSDLSSSEEVRCAARTPCETDAQCQQGAKCCPSLVCGNTCVSPLIVSVPKAGHCPRVQALQTLQPCMESSECSRDKHCAGTRKCCFSRCAMKCMEPVEAPTMQELPEALETSMPTARVELRAAPVVFGLDQTLHGERGLDLDYLTLGAASITCALNKNGTHRKVSERHFRQRALTNDGV
ncbi:whey acidic protein-like [Sorex araneus]|uniref:whey acidic protein-like n=1 Tax=Sorex araneus TaxID=42254 RepID=UPI0003317430|nr:whey acidic protein-like [Sorex araneus]